MGPTWGPPGSCRPQMEPMLAPWTLLPWMFLIFSSYAIYTCGVRTNVPAIVTNISYRHRLYFARTAYERYMICYIFHMKSECSLEIVHLASILAALYRQSEPVFSLTYSDESPSVHTCHSSQNVRWEVMIVHDCGPGSSTRHAGITPHNYITLLRYHHGCVTHRFNRNDPGVK